MKRVLAVREIKQKEETEKGGLVQPARQANSSFSQQAAENNHLQR
jgi:hypothetical protein